MWIGLLDKSSHADHATMSSVIEFDSRVRRNFYIRQFRQMAKRGKLKFFTILTDKHPQSDGGQASSFDHLFELPGIVRVMIAIRV